MECASQIAEKGHVSPPYASRNSTFEWAVPQCCPAFTI
jgi:hypothetical protein